jgi:uncharacterized protein (TIGR02611 family)
MNHRTLVKTYEVARRVVIGVIGGTVVLLGIVLIFLPGPAFVVIPVGLAILGIEFAWARHWLRIVKARAREVREKAGNITQDLKQKAQEAWNGRK